MGVKTDEEYIAYIKARTKPVGDCWVWQGFVLRGGYGQVGYRGRSARVHRLMYELHHGELPDDILVCHSCDVRLCCNPEHLWPGDKRANGVDVVVKGRHHELTKTHCPRGHSYEEHGYLSKRGKRSCNLCCRARQRIRAGWPEDLAHSMPATPKGQRPINGEYVRKRGRLKPAKVCKVGHSMDDAYIRPNGERQCRTCREVNRGRHEARAKAAVLALTPDKS
jgi:hypothetical protein